MKHGCTKNGKRTKEWRAWNAMIRRCKYPSMDRFNRYGGRGISVCAEWGDFLCFIAHVGFAPSELHSLGRIDNEKGYEPGNVRWETRNEQARNTCATRWITAKGETKCLAEWAEITGLKRSTITQRIDYYKWSADRAVTTQRQGT